MTVDLPLTRYPLKLKINTRFTSLDVIVEDLNSIFNYITNEVIDIVKINFNVINAYMNYYGTGLDVQVFVFVNCNIDYFEFKKFQWAFKKGTLAYSSDSNFNADYEILEIHYNSSGEIETDNNINNEIFMESQKILSKLHADSEERKSATLNDLKTEGKKKRVINIIVE